MSRWSRVVNAFRPGRVSAEIDEELASHLEEAAERCRDRSEARRSLGPALHWRETSRDLRVLPWLDALRADAVFGARQLLKHKVTSAAALLSLGLAIGSCTAAFRLIDALLWRGMPVSHPEQLYALSREATNFDGAKGTYDSFAYPDFLLMKAAVQPAAQATAQATAQP